MGAGKGGIGLGTGQHIRVVDQVELSALLEGHKSWIFCLENNFAIALTDIEAIIGFALLHATISSKNNSIIVGFVWPFVCWPGLPRQRKGALILEMGPRCWR